MEAATAMAILPFLGSGITHKDGSTEYRTVVYRGLNCLLGRQQKNGRFGGQNMDTGSMYAHGLATLCLAEVYGMTQDPALKDASQKAIDFILFAQDHGGGGWRYLPQQKGDTSVTALQMLALKEGQMAGLKIPAAATKKGMAFLDSVQSDDGSSYSYQAPEKASSSCSAMGLLCRLEFGWAPDKPVVERGVARLLKNAPTLDDFYHAYYATQLMHRVGGEAWKDWYPKMRDLLVDAQIVDKESHEFGSWTPSAKGDHGSTPGGRLYATSLGILILETPYRHPAPKKDADEKTAEPQS